MNVSRNSVGIKILSYLPFEILKDTPIVLFLSSRCDQAPEIGVCDYVDSLEKCSGFAWKRMSILQLSDAAFCVIVVTASSQLCY